MLGLIAANVRRRRARTFLTAAGIAVGVAAIVALLALSAGLNRTAGELVHLGGADLGLFQRDAGDPTSSVLPLSTLKRLRAEPQIADVTPIQLVVDKVQGAPGALVLGLDRHGFVASSLVITAGSTTGPGRVDVGDALAAKLHLTPGAELRIGGHGYDVAGVYHSGTAYVDSGAIATLRDAQRLAGRTAAETTTFAVRLAPQASAASAVKRLQRSFPGLNAIADPGQAARAGANTELVSKAVVLIVVLALIIGALTVANTMLAAVLERRRELALLATIGWSARQLGALVLGEAVAVSMLGTGVGLLLGLAASRLLPGALGLSAFISPDLTAWTLGRAALIGIIIGAIGAIYPIWRVTRIRTALALALR